MRFKSIALILMTVVFVFGCSNNSDNRSTGLFEGASSTSTLSFYKYDSAGIKRTSLSNDDEVEEIFEQFTDAKMHEVNDWSLDDITFPIYGFAIETFFGNTLSVTWSNGYWITADGSVYKQDYDFSKFNKYS